MSTARKHADAELPDGWRMVRVGDVAEINPKRPPLDSPPESTVTFLPMSAIAEDLGGIDERESREFRDVAKGYTYFEENDVLFAKITPCLQNGKHALATRLKGQFGFGTTEFHVVRAGPAIDHRFLFNALTRPTNIEKCVRSFSGTAGQQRIHPEVLRTLRVLIPPLPEQRAIADVLDSIDEAIGRTEAVIAATETPRDSVLHELLTRGVPGWHTEWQDVAGIGTIPADWKVVRLDKVATVERGKFAHRPRNEPRFYGGDIPFIQTSDVVRSVGVIGNHSQTLNELGLSISRLFPAGTVVITIAANIGETAIVGYPVAFPDSLVGITPTGVDGRFLEYYLRTQKARLQRFAPESAQKNINLEDLRPMLVPVPTMDEQTTISEQLGAVQDDVDSLRALLADVRALKISASEKLLSGRAEAWKVW